ncbi:MAG: TIGR00282 family metallophosphoesterase [Clostridia bacterium]|nr:TIGR00282 family metallophosphoesterase [Clostridia bacterium]MBR0510712.1 TIGR00282 family metallophosphoesterase [Clostridia bacterium]MBR0538184.1 TIGR00282 family metallophosphoesterase [Clostridia bacterium]
MQVLFIGDVVGEGGCAFLRRVLPDLKRRRGIDFCIVNGENSAAGNGMTPESCRHLLTSGADLVTGGNHSFRRNEICEYLDDPYVPVLRPQNFHASVPGRGTAVLERGRLRLGVMNLIGCAYMEPAGNPFDAADEILKAFAGQGVKCTLLDFHAEATGEKRAMGFYLDGRCSAVLGTHTHVPTADAGILPGGTAYITDVGMTGAKNSVLGVEPSCVIKKLRTGMPARFTQATGDAVMNAVLIELDETNGRAKAIEAIILE